MHILLGSALLKSRLRVLRCACALIPWSFHVLSTWTASLQWTFPPVCSGIVAVYPGYTIACNSSGPFYDRLVMAFRAAPAFSPVTRVLSGPQPVEPCQYLKDGDDNEISRVVSVFLCLSHSSHIAAGADDVDDNNEKDEHKDEHDDEDDDNDYEVKEEEEKEEVGL